MKVMKRFLSILLSLAMVLGLMPGMSLTAYAENMSWNIGPEGAETSVTATLDTSTGVLTISGTGPMKDYDYDVPWDNYSDSINSVTVGEGVTSIGECAFQNTKISSITIPSSVTSIGYQAFAFCENLQSITFEKNSGLTSIGEKAFTECEKLASITIPSLVTSIGEEAFNMCSSLQSIIFEDGSVLSSIGNLAFSGCGLTSVTIPSSVTSIGGFAFGNCDSLEKITFERGREGN